MLPSITRRLSTACRPSMSPPRAAGLRLLIAPPLRGTGPAVTIIGPLPGGGGPLRHGATHRSAVGARRLGAATCHLLAAASPRIAGPRRPVCGQCGVARRSRPDRFSSGLLSERSLRLRRHRLLLSHFRLRFIDWPTCCGVRLPVCRLQFRPERRRLNHRTPRRRHPCRGRRVKNQPQRSRPALRGGHHLLRLSVSRPQVQPPRQRPLGPSGDRLLQSSPRALSGGRRHPHPRRRLRLHRPLPAKKSPQKTLSFWHEPC
jgi:hypothetical protein